jgi:hypothetical protein
VFGGIVAGTKTPKHMKKIILTLSCVLMAVLLSTSSVSAQAHWDVYKGESILFCGSMLSIAELSDKCSDKLYWRGEIAPITSKKCCIKYAGYWIAAADSSKKKIDSVRIMLYAPITFTDTTFIGDTLGKMVFMEITDKKVDRNGDTIPFITTYGFTQGSSLYYIEMGFEESLDSLIAVEPHVVGPDEDSYDDVYILRTSLRAVATCLFCDRANIFTEK